MSTLSGLKRKVEKAPFLALIRIAGLFHPRTGTRLAIWFYQRVGMRMNGRPTFVSSAAWFDGTDNYSRITLSEGCSISKDVHVLTHDWSPYTAFRSLGRTKTTQLGRKADVVIGPHAFIGLGCIIMAGSSVGRAAVVGAGTVVRGQVPDYQIVIGNPMREVGDIRDRLLRYYPEDCKDLPALQEYLAR